MKTYQNNEYQMATYIGKFLGQLPVVTPEWAILEQQAIQKMEEGARCYIEGGAGLHKTLENNRLGFDKYKIIPRMLRNVAERNTEVEYFGAKFTSPFFLCPIGVSEMVWPEADLAIARGTAPHGIPYVFSNQGSCPMETTAKEMGETAWFFQLYWSSSRELVKSLVQRAEKAGAKAIVLTLDTTLLGWRTKDLTVGFLPFLEGKGIAQYTSDPVFMGMATELAKQNNTMGYAEDSPEFQQMVKSICPQLFIKIYNNPATTWDDLEFLKSITSLPIILKGILHPDDAKKTVEYGMDGVYVSNHGGRQVDGSISSIEALPAVVKAVDGKLPILFDSGIRGGADMFTALALGANLVGLGRPHVFGLTLAGQEGVSHVVRQLIGDFNLTMGLSGCKSVAEITVDCLAPINV